MKTEVVMEEPEEIRARVRASTDVLLRPRLHIVFEVDEVPTLKKHIIDRALNTLDSWPPFAAELEKAVTEFIAKHCPSVAP